MHASLVLLAFVPSALAHGYVKSWSADGGASQTAQKTSLTSSAFRAVSDNTGWIGANFLTSQAIACGASSTPRGTVAAPSGTFFATAGQAAGKTLSVKAGGKVSMVISGNPGEGWPHATGHIQTYLAYCGASATACQSFDATKGQFFKIQAEKNGIVNTLRPAYDSSVDGNRYSVAIPDTVMDGSYIFRFEITAFGQSSSAEGQQDQYYPFCGQIAVAGSSAAANKFSTVAFPGAYKNGNIDSSTLPGPTLLAAGTASNVTDTSLAASSGSSSSSSGGSSSSSSSSCQRRRRARRAHRQALRRHDAHAAIGRRDLARAHPQSQFEVHDRD